MITYVNTVLVSNGGAGAVEASDNFSNGNVGKFVIYDIEAGKFINSTDEYTAADRIKIGLLTSKSYTVGGATKHIIKWTNEIKKEDVKGFKYTAAPAANYTPETIVIDFNQVDLDAVDDGGYNIVLRVTYKDLPTRYRKWTESYNYVTVSEDTATEIAEGFAKNFAKNFKRNRVTAVANNGVLTLTAMPYDDDTTVDSLNWAGQVRFNANVYYTNPNAAGWASNNKYAFKFKGTAGTTDFIKKTVGEMATNAAKLVRDREAQAMGYLGILNRGEGTWPIIKPDMQTNLDNLYGSVTLEFENMYRAADDIFRKTKQAVEIYGVGLTDSSTIYMAIQAFAGSNKEITA